MVRVGADDQHADRGQAAVELALALPLVVMLLAGLVQLVVVARDQLAVEVAARDGARAAAVAAAPAAAADHAAHAAITLRPIAVATSVGGDTVTVSVTYVNPTDAPLIGRFVGDVELRASVTMAREPP